MSVRAAFGNVRAAFAQLATGDGGGGGGGGGGAEISDWDPDITYPVGAHVWKGPYLWEALVENTGSPPMEAPQNAGDASSWPGVSTNGSYPQYAGDVLTLNNNSTLTATMAWTDDVYTGGVLDRLFVFDISLSGIAEQMFVGVLDAAKTVPLSTYVAAYNNAGNGFGGLLIDFGGDSLGAMADGSVRGGQVAYARSIYSSAGFTRWAWSAVANGGSNWDLTVYRELNGSFVQVAQFLNRLRPGFTDFRLAAGSWNGGSFAGQFKVRGAWIRDTGGGIWQNVGSAPVGGGLL